MRRKSKTQPINQVGSGNQEDRMDGANLKKVRRGDENEKTL